MSANKKTLSKTRKPASSRLSLHAAQKKQQKPKTSRVKYLHVPLTTSRVLLISLRQFRTSKAKRSKRYKQIVITTHFLPYKEIAIVQRRGKRTAKKSRKVLFNRQTAAALLLIISGIAGAIYFSLNLSKAPNLELSSNPVPTSAVVQPPQPTLPSTLPKSEPTRVRIARLEINTTLMPVGRNSDGTMEVPTRYDIAGWYNLAPTPGERGPAIIVGHVDSPRGPAIFWRLRELTPGDIVEVDRADGTTVKFKVDSVQQYPQASFPTQEVYGNIDNAGIRLITCGGVFDRNIHKYSHNTVVFGSMLTEQ
ncbi:class F sortase [Candidatus Saccharibacteria bacterium]|nr:class F sortase [Candidatus Saccharibacteria bacterium]